MFYDPLAIAGFFGDYKLCQTILSTDRDDIQTQLGGFVQFYDNDEWSRRCYYTVYKIASAKFRASAFYRDCLLATDDSILAYAGSTRLYWTIGYACL